MIYKVLVIGHLLGDFYFQSDSLATAKEKNAKWLALHSGIYYCVLLIILWFSAANFGKNIWIGLTIVCLLHFAIDLLKIKLVSSIKKPERYAPTIFLFDQLIHILVLYLFVDICRIHISPNLFNFFHKPLEVNFYINGLLAGLICWKPASIFITTVFKSIPYAIVDTDDCGQISDLHPEDLSYNQLSGERIKVGSWIGILEREIILILGIMNQFGAIGFVLAAKSMARFKQLEDKSFAEKYLIGTLLSAMIALLCAVMAK